MAWAERGPSPNASSAESRNADRGRLKIFLGAAPGVGKTYEMLTQALERRSEGIDVLIGVVDTHGREETRRLTSKLPALPLARLPYHGRQLQELDLDGLLARKPQLALIDDLAHTNIPGSRHEKRWQDVVELLAAGIDIYTTLNIHHLESLNDIVAKISHVAVRETVPDRVLDGANQIELVDLPPDDLIKRLHEGKVYVPEAAEPALQHFFSPGNLTALRELAMRTAAERVEADMLTWRRARAIDQPWRTQERLMVLVGDSPDSARLVRLGRRLAAGAAWLVAHVSRPDATVSTAGEHVSLAFKLAQELGAETVLLRGQDVVHEILECATERNVTQIIVGRSRRRWRHIALQRSLASALLRQVRGIDITVVAGGDLLETGERAPLSKPLSLSHRGWQGYMEAVAWTAGSALLAWFLDPWLETANLGLVFLTAVLISAARAGIGPALLSSCLSFLMFNFVLTEPRYTLYVDNERDVLTLTFFLLVALVTGQLAARARRQMETIRANNRRIASLEDFSRRLTGIVGRDDLAWVLAEYLRSMLSLEAVVLLRDHASKLVVVAGDPGRDGLTDTETTAAQWAFDHREPAGSGTGTLPASGWFFVPLLGREEPLGVLGVRAADRRRSIDAEQQRLLFAMRDQAGVALEKVDLATEVQRSRLMTEADKLRAALLSSVSHDLRTPLVSIKGATTALMELDDALPATDKRELLENVLTETDRLNRYVQNLLDMTRLGYGALKPRWDWCDIRDIFGAAVRDLKHALDGRPINVTVAPGEELIRTDAGLLEQVLVNLLENAAKYSPADTAVDLAGRRRGDSYELRVSDHGPGIPHGERERVFDVFHRARATDQKTAGTGMGLAICKGFVEALGGTIEVSSSANVGGCTVRIRLPQPRDASPMPGAEE